MLPASQWVLEMPGQLQLQCWTYLESSPECKLVGVRGVVECRS